jgi:glycerophosphoryl diester phosphodiesterase
MIAAKRHRPSRTPHAPRTLDRVFLRPIAHRGLHSVRAGLVENTAPAFRAAIDKGYGIECDLQAAGDGVPMVFHDAKLERLMDASGPLKDHSGKELAKLRFRNSDEKMLTFSQFLKLVDGSVPLLVEVKSKGRVPTPGFIPQIAARARAYKGPIALMSFDRKIVASLIEHAPTVPCGAIVGSQQYLSGLWRRPRKPDEAGSPPRMFGSAPDGISFLAVDVKLAAAARKWLARHRLALPLFTWTVRTPRQREAAARWADAPIFETYQP